MQQPGAGEHNTLSTLSVVFAFVFAPAGALLGHLGLAQVRRTGERGRDRAMVGLTLSYSFIALAVVALVVWIAVREPHSTSTTVAKDVTTTSPAVAQSTSATAVPKPPPPPPRIEAAGMAPLLPSVDEMRAITGNQELADNPPDDPPEIGLPDTQTYAPVECAGSFSVFTPRPYENSGYRNLAWAVQAQKPKVNMQAVEGVAIFDDAAAAQRALANYVQIWRECNGRTLTWAFTNEGRSANFTLGGPEDGGPGITGLRSANQGPQGTVWMVRAIGAKANVLVDVQILGVGLTDEANRVVRQIFDRIPG
ncbi:sensor domain-containing protein [Mycobacterium sp. DL99]|uniref:sensor domain-containing protein n=1 Tax=Mycobacterium sp. DL99 TaxID=2528957 RepID=UPI001AEBB67F|nr:sensor domain-containing protein [Mycobacterium sp. DL99]